MYKRNIARQVNDYLYSAATELRGWLNRVLPQVSTEWWQECVLANLSYNQRVKAEEKQYTDLSQFDLAALLRIADKSWYDMRAIEFLPTSQRQCVRDMIKVRNNWAHLSGDTFDKDVVLSDARTIRAFFEEVIKTTKYNASIDALLKEVADTSFTQDSSTLPSVSANETVAVSSPSILDTSIRERDIVYLVSDPETKGMVFSVSVVQGTAKYDVFVGGNMRTFYEGQLAKEAPAPAYQWVDLNTFLSNLTAHELNNPSAGNLYSLNSARIDFVPYQFRPALKMIKSDEPRILIADSVGVGKTIEAGLIIKELEARSELDNILIICPKPLVAERKWELEMKRFDEEFAPLDGLALRQIISDTHRDGEWPSRFNKAIIPYSILDSKVYNGEERRGHKKYGLLDLDPPPHFDLVIIDEAHQIRNGSMEMEKAFAYKCVRYFCEHADAVVMLTATPLQTRDDDLFTLLNLLRPDVVMDKEVFQTMTRPNEYIGRSAHIVRRAGNGWQEIAAETLRGVTSTQWGESVIAKNPLYTDILNRLKASDITREERVKLLSDIESLHSFHTMINRTRRRDIQDFCVRRSVTVETHFTQAQEALHNELLCFEYAALSKLHQAHSVSFMMSTLRRQAASCIFGLAPQIRDIISRRFEQMDDALDIDMEEWSMDETTVSSLKQMAERVIAFADNLPDEDPKFDSLLRIIEEKQKESNNKIILFSTFRHTLRYLKKRLQEQGYRVAQIDGGVGDEVRRYLRERFQKGREEDDSLDILLFTEVGSEGLDYQFCDMMVNYDLPWNPMRIEQRIGRIDRRGQQSEAVNIYNFITDGTVDADIYERCLLRIGIFERSIGECEEVLGAIGSQIEKIALQAGLTKEERQRKLEQMADNEIRHMQELARLEDEQKSLFGFDLSNYTAAKEIRAAESPWLAPQNLQMLVSRYLNETLGEGDYIVGTSELKQLRLSKEARMKLLEDFRALSHIKSASKRRWELYLKGGDALQSITFVSEAAQKEHKSLFITPTHPLVKQAAKHFAVQQTSHIHLEYFSDELPEGAYPFSLYAWNYVGIRSSFKVIPVCREAALSGEILNILQDANAICSSEILPESTWSELEATHIALWQTEKEVYLQNVRSLADFKRESIENNYRNRKRNLEQKISDTDDERIQRMFLSELKTATENYNARVTDINSRTSRADIHTTLLAYGIIKIRKA